MRAILLMVCLVVSGSVFGAERTASSLLRKKVSAAGAQSHGMIPVRYHEMFGPYKFWTIQRGKTVSSFEARFVKIEKAQAFFGVDGEDLLATKQKQTYLYSVPLNSFDYQTQQGFIAEVKKRKKAEGDKEVLYPEPEKKKEVAEEKTPPAKPKGRVRKKPKVANGK